MATCYIFLIKHFFNILIFNCTEVTSDKNPWEFRTKYYLADVFDRAEYEEIATKDHNNTGE